MSRSVLIAAGICLALAAASAGPSSAARYALVDDGWGYECYGDYDHGAGMVVPLAGGRAVARGLDRALASEVQFLDGGRLIAWADASGDHIADLHSGRSFLLGRSVRPGRGFFVFDKRGRTALLVSVGVHVIVVRRRGAHLVRRVITGADGADAALSADGRYVLYSGDAGLAIQAAAGGPPRWIGSAVTSWSFSGVRLAYVDHGELHVLDARTGSELLDLPAPASISTGSGVPSWSADGRYIAFDGSAVVDVRARRTSALPAFAAVAFAWRPGGGHELLRTSYADSDLVDVATGAELWRHTGLSYLQWSPDGRWLLNRDGPPYLLSHNGVAESLPATLQYPLQWLGAHTIEAAGAPTLLVAAPPRWVPRVLARGAAGHHLTATQVFSASRAGLQLLARTFRSGAHTRDC